MNEAKKYIPGLGKQFFVSKDEIVKTLLNRIEDLENNQDSTDLENRVASLESTVNSLQSKLASAESAISDLETRVSELEKAGS
ncbi:hypothetical protein GXN76_11890 [Kroppenstedtia pulmonis]|uniref:Uncharacterized protein n=1 Tax=Kroppenstedtia pulmonis TaxID=1380685 RepID=A0A7D4CWL6_9BACL|nr:hypothetical protein [Kroppenstedtia pulmonis]QKG85097.1 hypothetical protein GXN76_11890 [Kroppenstedtia pulmonis]